MKIPKAERIEAAAKRLLKEGNGDITCHRLEIVDGKPEIQVLCILCETWCTAQLIVGGTNGPRIPVALTFESDKPLYPQMHVDLEAHVHDHECTPDAFEEDTSAVPSRNGLLVDAETGDALHLEAPYAELFRRLTEQGMQAMSAPEIHLLAAKLRELGVIKDRDEDEN